MFIQVLSCKSILQDSTWEALCSRTFAVVVVAVDSRRAPVVLLSAEAPKRSQPMDMDMDLPGLTLEEELEALLSW